MNPPPPQHRPQPTDATHVQKYGKWWPRLKAAPPNSAGVALFQEVDIELKVLRNYDLLKSQGSPVNSWTWHYMRLVSVIWGREDSGRRFVWNPNAELILEKIHSMSSVDDKMYLSIGGHASSGKSEFFAIFAIMSFLIGARHPDHKGTRSKFVKVFVTSTTLEESRGRIWGAIEAYWAELCKFFGGEQNLEAKLVSSLGKIVRIDKETGKQDQLSGIVLIAGGKGHDGDVDTKIGFKNRKVVMIADELPLLTHKLYQSALGNLASNPELQFIGLGNFTSPFDPFGVMAEPKEGWKSVDDTHDGWETKVGYCIRFDGEKSPNVLAGREVYPGLLTLESLNAYRTRFGEGYARNSEYYRMVRGFLAPDGDVLAIYTSAEIVGSGSTQAVLTWTKDPVMIAFLDPSFTHGGDEADMCVAKVGKMYNPLFQQEMMCLELISIENLMLKVDAKDEKQDRNLQLVNLYHRRCEALGIKVEDRGVDSTGAGDPFSTIMSTVMGRGFQMVSFAGAASDKPVSPVDRRPGTERFANRVTELWYVGKEMMKCGQLRGLDPDTCNQMISRLYKLVDRERVEVEPKKDMKKRTSGRSPDRADSLFGCIEVARRRHGLSSAARAAPGKKIVAASSGNREWDALSNMSAERKRRAVIGDTMPQSLGNHGGGFAWWGDYN